MFLKTAISTWQEQYILTLNGLLVKNASRFKKPIVIPGKLGFFNVVLVENKYLKSLGIEYFYASAIRTVNSFH